MLYEMIGVVSDLCDKTAGGEGGLTDAGTARPPLRSKRVCTTASYVNAHIRGFILMHYFQNRQNCRQDCSRAERRRARRFELGHFPPPQACEETAVDPPLRPPLHYALRLELPHTALLAKDYVARPSPDSVFDRKDGHEV